MHAHRHILLAINNTSTLQTDTREHTNTETWHCHNPTSSTQKESHGCVQPAIRTQHHSCYNLSVLYQHWQTIGVITQHIIKITAVM